MASANNIPWASNSCSMASQISSICSCAYPAGPATPTPSTKSPALPTSSSIVRSSTRHVTSTTTIPPSPPAFKTSTTTYASREFGPDCLANNCLRALDRYNANAFCSVFTLGNIGITGIPSYATPCSSIGNTMAQVSSACTCLNYYGNSMGFLPPSTPTGSAGTISAAVSSSLTLSISTSMSSSVSLFSTVPPKATSDHLTTTQTKPLATSVPSNAYCYANNCLRALKYEGGLGATAFCSSFTTAAVTNTHLLPTYATQCSTNPIAQMSSACTCIGSKAYATS
ncbi:uncharacterized protein LY89DRAFT_727190 [Mollisia scopiformis]|uniref:Uncharacterized protein n=1 Tax=Mollisia scopiformis TaxID=149040 RepID=A0A194XV05_MOLSC|nr:uncharacterized protein LY89DRAFT_727190 [Mollisia scopiformis]KUJ24155.1 hypothetical protein LY89DRAFT_727190 [Mollisia scopiformis]